MTQRICGLLVATACAAAVPAIAIAAQTPVMTFEEFADGATNVGTFYNSGTKWLNEEVFNSAGTPALSPFAGPNPNQANVLTVGPCDVGISCDLELQSTSPISSITLSGLISSGPNLEMRAFNGLGQPVGGPLVVDTEQQSVGCLVVTSWSCNREFDFTLSEDVRGLLFSTSLTAVIDNVQVTTFEVTPPPVPEPTTLALLGLGLLGVAAGRRRHMR